MRVKLTDLQEIEGFTVFILGLTDVFNKTTDGDNATVYTNQANAGGQCNVEIDADGNAARVCLCFDGVNKWDDSHICDVGPCQDSPYYQPDGPLWNPCHHGGTCKGKALHLQLCCVSHKCLKNA